MLVSAATSIAVTSSSLPKLDVNENCQFCVRGASQS